MKTADPFYKSARWKAKRSVILRRDRYKCQLSARYGKNVPADTVHHIFPREQYPEYKYAAWNLIAVCAKVHDELHDRASGALTEKGMDLLRRTARRRGIRLEQEEE
jgi:5-methylcytosine-specific restriction endonuclease McrA